MRMLTLRETSPAIRWLHGWWPDHNPLRRASDRTQAAVGAILLAGFLVSAPLLALAAAQWVRSAAISTVDAQRATRHQVSAVLVTSAPARPADGTGPSLAQARWTAPGGQARTGQVSAQPGAAAGSVETIWVDQQGRVTDPPMEPATVAGQQILAAVFTPVAVGLVLLGVWGLARRGLDRQRMAAWDADWRATGPRWTSRR